MAVNRREHTEREGGDVYGAIWRGSLALAATILYLSGRWTEGPPSWWIQLGVTLILGGASLRALELIGATRLSGDSLSSAIPWSSSLLVIATGYLTAQATMGVVPPSVTYSGIYLAVLAVAARWPDRGWTSLTRAVGPAWGLEISGAMLGYPPAGGTDGAVASSPGAIATRLALVAVCAVLGRALATSFASRSSSPLTPEADARDEIPPRTGLESGRQRETLDMETHFSGGDRSSSATSQTATPLERTLEAWLSMLHQALEAHACLLLWYDDRHEHLQLRTAVGIDSERLVEAIDPARGVVGSLLRAEEGLMLNDLRSDVPGLVYYDSEPEGAHFIGMPIEEDGHTRGLICVDRTRGSSSFEDEDLEVLETIRHAIVREVRRAREYSDVEAENIELERFFRASRRLNNVLTPSEVLEAALHSASDVLPYDFAAITTYDSETERHRIAALEVGDCRPTSLEVGQTFETHTGLLASAIKNEHYLPADSRIEGEPVIFEASEHLGELQALLVLPLVAHDRALGTLVVGRTIPEAISDRHREMLQVITRQVAVSLQNARLYARMEQLATTDELTGLPNRRTFEERLEEALARHRRAQRSLGIIMIDIDHFKDINDTHGHAVGDRVLTQVAETLGEAVREVDVPARYGGEEFIVLLEETDPEGARTVAERIRTDIESLTLETPSARIACTVSLGVALWPEDGRDPETLIEHADDALYASKEGGRNQVKLYAELGESPTPMETAPLSSDMSSP